MEKTLVYHLYIKENFLENVAYDVHAYCLKKYIHIFDKVKFTISLDDLSRHDLLGYAYEWINSLGINCEMEIYVIKNTELGEADTFKREILDMRCDGMVFFAHSKGVGKVFDGKMNSSVLIWTLLLYYENLNEIGHVEKKFLSMPLEQTIFHGTLLIGSAENEPLQRAFGKHFSGNFFWVNMPKYKNWRKIGRIPDLEPDSRWFIEIYPNMVCCFEMMGGGMDSRDHIWLEMETIQSYTMTIGEWLGVFEIYKNTEPMMAFIDEIHNYLGIEHVDFDNKW